MGDAAYPPGCPETVPKPWNPRDDPRQQQQMSDDDDIADPDTKPDRYLANAPKLDIPGYEGCNFMNGMQIAAPPRPPPPRGEPPPLPNTDLAKLDEEACRAAMIQHVSEHCCYGSKPAKEMKFNKIEGITALHLTLESFTEGRETANKHTPYKGGPVDGPQNGTPPGPWDMDVPPNEMFDDHKIKREVPHTSKIKTKREIPRNNKPCWECDRKGWNTCWCCHGRGRNRCNWCGGRGHTTTRTSKGRTRRRRCGFCGGRGKTRCMTCGGDGRITCDECEGYKDLRCFVQLICNFLNNDDEFVLETTDLPDELVTTVGGTVLFQDVQILVRPLISYPVPEVNANSDRLVKEHEKNWPSQRILKQRQTLRGVPVTEVGYDWDDVKTRFWVYGNERRVYAPDYPQQCCCGCSIL